VDAINILQSELELEIREASETYLEAVVTRAQIERCCEVLAESLGPAARPMDGSMRELTPDEKTFVASRGGVRSGQGLYLKPQDDGALWFAFLWPWGDPSRITLKLGIRPPA